MSSPLGVGRHWPFDFEDATKCIACGTVLTNVTQLKEPCMKREYKHKSGAWAMVNPTTDPLVFQLDNMKVPAAERGQGIGSDLLLRICDDADRAGVTLRLTVHEDREGPTTQQLVAWYFRFGFQGSWLHMERKPNPLPTNEGGPDA